MQSLALNRPVWQLRRLAQMALMALVACGTAQAETDLLKTPAQIEPKALESKFMDITRTGSGRLVAVGERGQIMFSDDGGRKWTQAKVPVSVTLTAVRFPSPQQGWAVGHDSVILHSADGGTTWTKRLDGHEVNPLILGSTEALVAQRREALDAAPKGGHEPLQTALEDAEYLLKEAKRAVDTGPSRPFMDIWFRDPQRGMIFGAFGLLLETDDGGENWRASVGAVQNLGGRHLYGAESSGKTLILAGESGQLHRSVDDGRHWERLKSPYEGSLFNVVAGASAPCVLAVGLRGNLVRSCDAGQTWAHSVTTPNATLNGGVVLDDGTMVVVGMAGVAFVSRDGGQTLTPWETKFPGCMAVADGREGTVVLVGLGGIKRMALPAPSAGPRN